MHTAVEWLAQVMAAEELFREENRQAITCGYVITLNLQDI
jgi:hypothetical protein